MLRRLFGLGGTSNRAITDALYGEIVAAARQPRLYSQWNVPDTPLGRFEMLSAHLMLVMERMSKAGGELHDIAQELTDEFFRDVEHSLRELGIGDMGVPKRMKKLARMYYGRAESYSKALRSGDRDGLADALRRNVLPDAETWPQAHELASYLLDCHARLAAQSDADLLRGRMTLAAGHDHDSPT